jgi:hypothetical protein
MAILMICMTHGFMPHQFLQPRLMKRLSPSRPGLYIATFGPHVTVRERSLSSHKDRTGTDKSVHFGGIECNRGKLLRLASFFPQVKMKEQAATFWCIKERPAGSEELFSAPFTMLTFPSWLLSVP